MPAKGEQRSAAQRSAQQRAKRDMPSSLTVLCSAAFLFLSLLFSALDFLTIGIHEIASISERRIERLVNPVLSGLPAFLVNKGGLHSGFMIAHVRDSSTPPRRAARHHAFAIAVLGAALAAWERPLHRLAGWLADAFLFLFFLFFFLLFFFPVFVFPFQCTAAALVSENKTLCHPASVDSLSTSAAQEGGRTHTGSTHAPARSCTVMDWVG